jgi:hypothetical protein
MKRLSALLFALLSVSVSAMPFDGYEYKNCADQSSALPLEKCARIAIGSDLGSVMIRDVGKADLVKGEASGRYAVLNSAMLPLALPKSGYGQKDKWTYEKYGYTKIVSKQSYLGWEGLDLIAVAPKLDSDEATFERNHVRFETKLTFWFSPSDGVVAIAFPDRSSALADTYFCSRKPCLFGSGAIDP